ncbi:MAG: cytochrome c maturation protein CcmE [Deltaproteobacteria bacterium]|nr:cytochrome c maturation protein CcmE [Deltaproteobacteria bacterium]
MTGTRSRRLALGISLLVALAALGLLASGLLGRNIVYYWTPTQLLDAGDQAQGARIRLGGRVAMGSIAFDEATAELRFRLHDDSREVSVRAVGTPPEMFREGIGAVVEGTLARDGVFEARRLLVKHDNRYRAPVEGRHSGDPFESVEDL